MKAQKQRMPCLHMTINQHQGPHCNSNKLWASPFGVRAAVRPIRRRLTIAQAVRSVKTARVGNGSTARTCHDTPDDRRLLPGVEPLAQSCFN